MDMLSGYSRARSSSCLTADREQLIGSSRSGTADRERLIRIVEQAAYSLPCMPCMPSYAIPLNAIPDSGDDVIPMVDRLRGIVAVVANGNDSATARLSYSGARTAQVRRKNRARTAQEISAGFFIAILRYSAPPAYCRFACHPAPTPPNTLIESLPERKERK